MTDTEKAVSAIVQTIACPSCSGPLAEAAKSEIVSLIRRVKRQTVELIAQESIHVGSELARKIERQIML